MLVFLALFSLLAGGGAAAGYGVHRFQQGKESRKAVSDFLDAYISLDEEKCAEHLYHPDMDILEEEQGFSELQKSFAENISYKILGSSKEEAYDVVKVRIENTDFQALVEEILKENRDITEDQFEEMVMERVANSTGSVRKYECTVNVYSADGEKKIEMTDSFSNALLGGFPEYIASVTREELQK